MKTKTISLVTLLIIILLTISSFTTAQAKAKHKKKSEKTENKTIMLFNGKDLNNWVFKLKDPSIDPATVFTVQNGVIHISGNPSVKKLAASSEKPTGEWNTMEIICKANTIEVNINGVLQNRGTNVNLSRGSICLQSEGKEIEFRNVVLTSFASLHTWKKMK